MTQSSNDQQHTILVLPSGQLYDEIIDAETEQKLQSLGRVIRYQSEEPGGRRVDPDQVAELIGEADAVLTSWGAPKFDEKLLSRATKLKVIAHAAGTIKSFIPPEVFDRGIAVTHAAALIAEAVGEWALTVTLMSLRRAYDFDRAMHDGAWAKRDFGFGEALYGKRVGIVAASMTGRAYIKLLAPFGCDIVVFDPYLSDERAKQLGVTRIDSLNELFRTSDVVSNHAPTTPETDGMIGAKQLSLLRDGKLFVNTARARAIDYPALVKELQSGRIRAALDVFPKEPLEADSPLRGLPNVILSPHVAGGTEESRKRLGAGMVEELRRFLAGEKLQYGVTKQMLATMA
ncbi:MAG TPA: hydroxyacid dehydrogenase [Chloroflexota bacterium]|nr:hydroxyacid dehydrogenase [Chloroflexota bacterium]